MSYSSADVQFLKSFLEQGVDPESLGLALTKKSAIADVEKLKKYFSSRSTSTAGMSTGAEELSGTAKARLVMELLSARAKAGAAHKLPATWLMSNEASQQATPLVVARLRAYRINALLGSKATRVLVNDVTCSIGTEGIACTEEGLDYVGSDLDFARLLMAEWNMATATARGASWFVQADALAPVINHADVIVADPGRRKGGRRITRSDELEPPLNELLDAYPGQTLAVKCAPGLDFSEWESLVSVVSVDGGVKEACLYSEKLSAGITREAVMIHSVQGNHPEQLPQTDAGALHYPSVIEGVSGQWYAVDVITDAMPDHVVVGEPGRYIIDPDGAVVRAGLVRNYAAREGLWMLDEHIAYLTGDVIPRGASGCEYLETVQIKNLRKALASYDCGSVEILIRGVDLDPDALRKKLKLKGHKPMTVVCTRIGDHSRALICGPRIHNPIAS